MTDKHPAQSAPAYAIDMRCPTERGMNPSYLISQRMCAVCRKEGSLEIFTSSDPRLFIHKIYECCRRKPDYMAPRATLAELVFRVIIARKNEPMDAEEIASTIRNIRSQHVIKRIETPVIAAILRADRYYGFIETDRSCEKCPT